MEQQKLPSCLPVTLALVAGIVDTLGFVGLFSFFTAHVTGNFVVLGAALVQPVGGLIAKLLSLPAFAVGVTSARLCERALIGSGRAPESPLLWVQAIFLVLFMLLGIRASPISDGNDLLPVCAALCGVVAMAFQNATSRTVFASLSPTTVMTGNVTQIVLDTVDLVSVADTEARVAARNRLRKFGPPVIAFAAGAALGAIGFRWAGFGSLSFPCALLAFLAVRTAKRSQP